MKGEQNRLKELEKALQATQIALAEKTIALDVAETLIEKVNRHYSTDVIFFWTEIVTPTRASVVNRQGFDKDAK